MICSNFYITSRKKIAQTLQFLASREFFDNENFPTIVSDFYSLTIAANLSILDVSRDVSNMLLVTQTLRLTS